MQGPEEYNVLHIDPESSVTRQDQKIILEAKKMRLMKVANRLFVGVLAVGLFFIAPVYKLPLNKMKAKWTP